MTQFAIKGGFNGVATPLELASRALQAQESTVQTDRTARYEVLREVVTLCSRFDAESFDDQRKNVALRTPHTLYDSAYNDRPMTIALAAVGRRSRYTPGLALTDYVGRLDIINSDNVAETMYWITPRNFICRDLLGQHEGSRSELNIFRGVVDKIRAAHFPKAK